MTTLNKAVVVADHVSDFDDIAHSLVLEDLDRLRPVSYALKRERTYLGHRDRSSEELDEITRLHDNVRIKSLSRRLDRHGPLDQIQNSRHSLRKPVSDAVGTAGRTYMLVQRGNDMAPDFPQIHLPVLGEQRSEAGLLQERGVLLSVRLELLKRQNRPVINIIRVPS